MGRRERLLSKAILYAIVTDNYGKPTVLRRILAFFQVCAIQLARYEGELFQNLRKEAWQIDERSYRESFNDDGKNAIKWAGDLGYSGSVRF